MRLIIVLLTTAILQVSAIGYAQKVTLIESNARLSNVLDEIRKQTGYDFVYSDKVMSNAKRVSLNIKNAELSEALEICFKDQPLSFKVEDKMVVIKPKETSFLENVIARFQNIDVRGKVVDEKGQPLPGATVSVKGTNQVAKSDANGIFYLTNVDEKATVMISFIGYKTLEVAAKKDLGISPLKLEENSLSQVQVIGYGEVSKRFSTSNIGTVAAEEIARQPVSNPLLALAGRVPGLFIQQQSGVTLSAVKVTVQGQNSINSSNEPLYVIDGIPYAPNALRTLASGALTGLSAGNFGFINPSDIESVSILKDADATAIYGSRAANGAIIITTKKGKAGKAKVDINLQNGWGKVTRTQKMMSTQQYLEMRKESYINIGEPVPDGSTTPDFSNADITVYDQNKYTDFQKEFIGGLAHYNDLQASVSGGTENTQFLGGYGFHRETTVYPGDLSDKKGNVRFSINHTSSDKKFSYLASSNYLQAKNTLNNEELAAYAYTLAPNTPDLINSDGSLNWAYLPGTTTSTIDNPLKYTLQRFTGNTSNLIANNTISYEVIHGLTLKSSMGYNKLEGNETSLTPLNFSDPNTPGGRLRGAQYLNRTVASWIVEPQITYLKNTDFGAFDALIGGTFQNANNDVLAQSGIGYTNDQQLGNLMAATTRSVDAIVKTVYRYSAIFGRLSYRLKDKYLLNVTARRDGSSRFGNLNKFNNFYSVGGAWLFGDEAFLKSYLPWLSYGKLRGNYGTTGNDQIGEYKYLSLLSNYPGQQIPYLGGSSIYPANINNPLLQWEETRKLNLGADLGFLRNKFLFNVNYFRNRSGNQLGGFSIPSITGFTAVVANFPAVVQNSGLEFQLDISAIQKRNFTWHSSINLTVPRNKLVAYPGLKPDDPYVIGQPVSIIKTFKFAGVNKATGIYQFVDNKGELTSQPSTETDLTQLIDIDPKYYGGWSNSFSYKGFQLDILFQFVKQVGGNNNFGYAFPGYIGVNEPINILNRWRKEGDIVDVQQSGLSGDAITGYINATISDRFYSDASFIRLKNAALSYSIPASICKKAAISNARIYMQGQNLLTITNYEGSDPESKSGPIPPLRMFTLGLQFTF